MRTLVYNFPENYPWYRKLFCNLLFLVLGTRVLPRKNKLSNKDLRNARKILKKGDIILGGDSRTLFSKLVRNPITHSMLYLGNNKIIHSMGANGVIYSSLTFVFTKYDTLIILRVPEGTKKKVINEAIKYAKLQFKKPYDFELKPENEAFFCVELINKSFEEAGYETGLSLRDGNKIIFKKSREAIKAHDFLKGNFDLIFKSHNLKIENNEVTLLTKNT